MRLALKPSALTTSPAPHVRTILLRLIPTVLTTNTTTRRSSSTTTSHHHHPPGVKIL
ncbi:hypothetical protein LguiA_005760 [Lonicera macranthoides]